MSHLDLFFTKEKDLFYGMDEEEYIQLFYDPINDYDNPVTKILIANRRGISR